MKTMNICEAANGSSLNRSEKHYNKEKVILLSFLRIFVHGFV